VISVVYRFSWLEEKEGGGEVQRGEWRCGRQVDFSWEQSSKGICAVCLFPVPGATPPPVLGTSPKPQNPKTCSFLLRWVPYYSSTITIK